LIIVCGVVMEILACLCEEGEFIYALTY